MKKAKRNDQIKVSLSILKPKYVKATEPTVG